MNADKLNEYVRQRTINAGLSYQVGGYGNIDAEVVIIAESPSFKDVQAGSPFIGATGNMLFERLRDITGLSRLDVYVTNVAKHQITASDKKSKPNAQQTKSMHEILRWELSQLPRAKHYLLLGNMALKFMTGHSAISKWRGSVFDLDCGGTAVATFSPINLFREPMFKPIFGLDMHKFNRVLLGKYKKPALISHINPNFKTAWDWLSMLHDSNDPISFDIETAANETVCVGLTNSIKEGMCINWRNETEASYTVDEEMRLRLKIQKVLQSKKLVAQNGNFDSHYLWFKDRIRPAPIWFDTMLAHHTLYSVLPHGLGFLTTQYTDHSYYKDDKDVWKDGGNIDSFWRYNIKDCCVTLECQQRLLQELRDNDQDRFFFNHVMKLQPELVRMTVLGIKIDADLKDQIIEEVGADVENTREKVYRSIELATGKSLRPNLQSNVELPKLFFDDLGFERSNDSNSTAEGVRTKWLENSQYSEAHQQVILDFNHFSKERKFFSTYAKMELDYDGRVRSDYKQMGVKSAPGRLSSSKTLWGSGGNLQNQPERSHKMFIANDGYEFSYTDGSQAEARVVAVIWQVKALLENFEKTLVDKGFDVHRANAARIFNKSYEEIPTFDRHVLGKTTDDPAMDGKITLRFLGKRCVHGLNYRMEPATLANACNIPLWRAIQAYNSYHKTFPEIKRGWTATFNEVKKTRMLTTPLGRRLYFLGVDFYRDESALDSMIAFVPQSTIGDWETRLIVKCHNDPRWPKTAWICLQVHDAVIAHNEIKDGPIVRAIMKHYAEEPIQTEQGPIIIPHEFKKSYPDKLGIHRWSNLEDVNVNKLESFNVTY